MNSSETASELNQLPTAEAADPLRHLGKVTEISREMASKAALAALERALAAAQMPGPIGPTAGEMRELADTALRAAEHMRNQLAALEAMAGLAKQG